jgi:hypothetical protein
MKSRIRGKDAAYAAIGTAKRLPVVLQAADVVGPVVQPSLDEESGKSPPRVRKPSSTHDVIYASTDDLGAHQAQLREMFGTQSDEFVATMMGKLISGLRPNPFDTLEQATLNAALATIASYKTTCEAEALLVTQIVIAGFSAFRMLELSQRHLGEENIAVYGGFAMKLFKIQNQLIETLNRSRRGNSQSIVVKHVHIHPGAQGVVGIVNRDEIPKGGTARR